MSVRTVCPAARTYQTRQYGTSGKQGIIPGTGCVIILIVHLKDGFPAPFTRFFKDGSIIIYQIILLAADNLLHVLQRLSITAFIILVHHDFGIQHIDHRLCNTSVVNRLFLHRQYIHGYYPFQIGNDFFIYLIRSQLFCQIRRFEVHIEIRDIAPELPQPIIIKDTESDGLGRVVSPVLLCNILSRPF